MSSRNARTPSPKLGASTSDVEVTNVDAHGIWLFVKGRKHFLRHDQFPWFRDARLRDILNVQLLPESHLHWPALDVDLCLESLDEPDAFPLTYR